MSRNASTSQVLELQIRTAMPDSPHPHYPAIIFVFIWIFVLVLKWQESLWRYVFLCLCVCFSLGVCVCVCVYARAHMCMQDINLLSDMACRCFSTYLGCLFIFLRVFSAAQMFFCRACCLFLLMLPVLLESRPQNCRQAQLIEAYAMFSPSWHLALVLKVGAQIHFELII